VSSRPTRISGAESQALRSTDQPLSDALMLRVTIPARIPAPRTVPGLTSPSDQCRVPRSGHVDPLCDGGVQAGIEPAVTADGNVTLGSAGGGQIMSTPVHHRMRRPSGGFRLRWRGPGRVNVRAFATGQRLFSVGLTLRGERPPARLFDLPGRRHVRR